MSYSTWATVFIVVSWVYLVNEFRQTYTVSTYKCLKNLYHYCVLIAKEGEVVKIENDTFINGSRKVYLNGAEQRLIEEKLLEPIEYMKEDNVNHPKHYTSHPSGIECIDITRHYCFAVGNAIKYLWRAGLKQEQCRGCIEKEVEDLKKAIWYINDRIKQLEDGEEYKITGRCDM